MQGVGEGGGGSGLTPALHPPHLQAKPSLALVSACLSRKFELAWLCSSKHLELSSSQLQAPKVGIGNPAAVLQFSLPHPPPPPSNSSPLLRAPLK